MATFNKFDAFTEHLAEGVHNLGSNTLKIYLTNNAPSASADAVKADLAGIAATNGYSELTVTVVTSTQAAGVYTLAVSDPSVITASGGAIPQFRYAVLYNDTPTSPADPLIGWWDYGSAVDVLTGETFTIDLATNLIQLT
jgi:hypothetical protein